MTSAMIQDVGGYTNIPAAPANKPRERENSDDFMNMMNGAMGKKDGTTILSDHLSRTKNDRTESYDLVNTKPQKFDAAGRVQAANEKKPVDAETATKTKDALESYGGKVRDKLKDEMDVSDEEITEAMEALGLTYADLLNPDNMKQLISQLSGEDGLAALLTDAGFPNLLSELQGFGEELMAEVGLQGAQIKGIEVDLMLGGEIDEGGITLPELDMAAMRLPDDPNAERLFEAALPPTDENGEPIADMPEPAPEERPEIAADPATLAGLGENAADEVEIDDILAQPAETANANAAPQPIVTDTVDETDDLLDVPEESLKNLTQQTGQTAENTADSGNDAAEEMLNRSRESRANNIEASIAVAESTTTQTFTQTVINAAGEQAVELVQSYTSVDTQEVISQIVTQARTTISETVTQMEMMLNPENLGRMILQVTQQEGAITARFIAQSEGVREALQMQLELLRESLNQAGVRVEAVEVSVGAHEFERALEEGMTDNTSENGEQGANGGEADGADGTTGARRDINLNNLDELGGVMTEEEALVANMMRDQGNTMNVTA